MTTVSDSRGSWAPAILIAGDGALPIHRDVLLGAHECVRRRGWRAISQRFVPPEILSTGMHVPGWGRNAYDLRQAKRNMEQWIRDWRPRSVLTLFARPELVAYTAQLAPTVAGMTYSQDLAVPSIDVDETAVVAAAADHLIGLGLREFAVIGSWAFPWAVQRARIFQTRIRAAGFACHRSARLRPTNLLATSVTRSSMSQWLASLPKPIGILACSDPVGMHLMHHCHAAGVRVPEDAAILAVGNDDITWKMVDSPLSSVAINWQQIGFDAADMAGWLAMGLPVPPQRTLVRPAGVVVRQSTDLLAADDPEVSAALRHIRENADRPLSVAELLQRMPVDRNRLERRFRQVIGRRILQEVRRVHVDQAKRLLSSTEWPMPRIAAQSGFSSAAKLSTAFRTETGLTPSAYRRKFRLSP